MKETRNKKRKFLYFYSLGGLLLFFFLFIAGCSTDADHLHDDVLNCADSISILEGPEVFTYCSTHANLDGVWGLSNYFDPILTEKSIANCRQGRPVRFGILFEIKNDSVFAFGALIDMVDNEINCLSDTLTVFESLWGQWALLNKGKELHLTLISNEDFTDTITYVYRKRPDLNRLLTGDNKRRFFIQNQITEYFNEKLLAGSYLNSTGDTVCFNFDGSLADFPPYSEYRIDPFFGTSHHSNLYGVHLRNGKKSEVVDDLYHWELINEQLILTEFVWDTILYNGEWVEKDNLVLSDNQLRLKVIK